MTAENTARVFEEVPADVFGVVEAENCIALQPLARGSSCLFGQHLRA